MALSKKPKTMKTKIIIAGEPGAGKSFIVQTADACVASQEIGVSIGKISETIEETSNEMTLMTWAITEGRPKESTHMDFASAAIIVCDLTKPKTVSETTEWAHRVLNHAGNIPLFFAANNANLGSQDTYRQLRKVAHNFNSPCFPIPGNDRKSARDLLKFIAWELSEKFSSEDAENLVSW
jgi:signal recognition particle receptor subunit beta